MQQHCACIDLLFAHYVLDFAEHTTPINIGKSGRLSADETCTVESFRRLQNCPSRVTYDLYKQHGINQMRLRIIRSSKLIRQCSSSHMLSLTNSFTRVNFFFSHVAAKEQNARPPLNAHPYHSPLPTTTASVMPHQTTSDTPVLFGVITDIQYADKHDTYIDVSSPPFHICFVPICSLYPQSPLLEVLTLRFPPHPPSM